MGARDSPTLITGGDEKKERDGKQGVLWQQSPRADTPAVRGSEGDFFFPALSNVRLASKESLVTKTLRHKFLTILKVPGYKLNSR